MNALKTDLRRALTSWGFIAGIAGLAIAAFFGVFEQMLPVFQGQYAAEGLPEGFTIQLVFSALSSDVVLLVLPILCAIPFTPAFVDDFKSRYIREYLPRCGNKNYTRAKVFATAISGGLTLLLGVLLVLLVFSLLFLPMEVPPEVPEMGEDMMQLADTYEQADITSQQNFAELMVRAFVFFLCGGLWSLVGGLMATVTMSKYMAYASPFIFYYVLVILAERYFTDLYVINPQEWIAPAGDWVGGTWGVALLVGELILILGFLYAHMIGRRLKDA